MKLSTDEKRRLVSALSYAIAASPPISRAEFTNLRKKLENALRTEA